MPDELRILTASDFIVPIIWVPILLFVLAFVRVRYMGSEPWNKYLLAGFVVRLVSIIFFAIIYQFVYGTGDTFLYYQEAVNIRSALFNGDVSSFFQLIFASYEQYSPTTLTYVSEAYIHEASHNHLMVVIAGLFNLFAHNSYITIAVFLMVYSYFGMWQLYTYLCRLYPERYQALAVIFLFLPTPFFWASGVMKEPLCMGAVGLIVTALLKLIHKEGNVKLHLLYILFNSLLLYNIKGYILLCLAGACLLASVLVLVSKIAQSKRFSFLRMGAYLALGIITVLALNKMVESFETEGAQTILKQIGTTQAAQMIANDESGGSGYTLSEFNPTPTGVIIFASSALNTTLFRPYFWELKKVIMLLNALEAFLTLLISIAVLYYAGIRTTIHTFRYSYLFQVCLFFTIFLGVVVGIISFNYGTLVRYKAPLLPFYFLSLLLLYHNEKAKRERGKHCLQCAPKRGV